MPTLTYHRIWCKKCADWSLHYQPAPQKQWVCNTCGTEYTDITYAEIPPDLLNQQRERYTASNKQSMDSLLTNALLGFGNPIDVWNSRPKTQIIEHDAGQKAIDAHNKKIQHEKYLEQVKKQKAREEERLKFVVLGRNDQCACGSGKKYKKCCMWKYS